MHLGTGKLEQTFLLPGEDDLEALPGNVSWYLMHPILYSAPFWVRPVPGLVVGPGLPFPPEEDIRTLAYYSCFICCGKPDEKFARKLYRDLEAHGVESWLYVESARAGDPIWPDIKKELDAKEKWIVFCSLGSLSREGVRREIEEMVDKDRERIVPLSLDGYWKDESFEVRSGSRNLKPFLVERTSASFSGRGSYSKGLSRLLRALSRR